jgi:hypothetical protein
VPVYTVSIKGENRNKETRKGEIVDWHLGRWANDAKTGHVILLVRDSIADSESFRPAS